MASIKLSRGDKWMGGVNAIALGVLTLLMLAPLLKVLATSFSSGWAADSGQVLFWPTDPTFAAWEEILKRGSLWRSLFVTASAAVIGTALALLFTSMFAYPLSKKEFKPAKLLMLLILITMIFRVPIIPYFLAIKSYGLINNYWVLIVPFLFTGFNVIIVRTFFKQFPKELEEAAQMEGCGYFRLLFRIVLPTSKAVLATIGIFTAVMIWNQFRDPLLFIHDQELYPLQLRLRTYVTFTDMVGLSQFQELKLYSQTTLSAAAIIFAVTPILAVYPFLQKHFIKGAFLGSIK
ncbi:carbohydrate ABC transporter permease [Paenibacillus koleovorans]|uniref:carbohydrate ABC transporter permease n=1 Tax=Paenibacillus koleovorans TaxID=121608 RepID=UPI001C3FB4CB|nr:carbohydrate ABC transporter permease [Paenibacillus koleovorans]